MLRIATANVNGIRAAWRKGMKQWLQDRDADIITVQEVRAPDAIMREVLDGTGYQIAHTEAAAKGRAGVAVLSRLPILQTRTGNGDPFFDDSGRWVEAEVSLPDGSTLTVVSAYVHTGEAGTPRQDDKYRFLDRMALRMDELASGPGHAVVTGDLNVGHTERDIKNWKGNLKKAGFLPQERAYFDRFFGEMGWVDVHRTLAGDVEGPYTWWSMRGQAFDNDSGWRIDYQIATAEFAALAEQAVVDRAASWGERWSDHAPLTIDYAL